jgi:LacI family transcriptional regulator
LPPEGIALRGSTDMIAVEDARVNAAVHYMRDHLAEIEGINSVTPQVGVSRRCLEKEFQRLLGCTPYQYLCRLRVEKAKALLSGSERLKMRAIATACGFTSIFHLRSSFLRAIGTLPSAYRQMCERRRAGLNPEGGRLPRRPRRRPLKKSPND